MFFKIMRNYFIILFIFIQIIHLQDCNDNEFILGENGESWLKVNKSFCECKGFIGDGSKLNGIDKTQSFLNLQAQINVLQKKILSFFAHDNIGTLLAPTSFTKVQLSATLFNIENCFNTSNYLFTPTVPGIYLVNWNIGFVGILAGTLYGSTIIKNGVEQYYGSFLTTPVASAGFQTTGSTLISMNGLSDYIELSGYNGGSSALYTNNGQQNIFSTYMSAVWVGSNS